MNIKLISDAESEAELPVCLDVIHRSFATVAEEFGLTEQNCPTSGAFMPLPRLQNDFNKNNSLFGLYKSSMLIGFMQLVKKDENTYSLEKLAVLPEHRHNGYGKKLIIFAADKVRELGGNKITIGIIEENTQLKNWYATNGFIHMGTGKFDYLPFTAGFMEMKV